MQLQKETIDIGTTFSFLKSYLSNTVIEQASEMAYGRLVDLLRKEEIDCVSVTVKLYEYGTDRFEFIVRAKNLDENLSEKLSVVNIQKLVNKQIEEYNAKQN